MTTLFKFNFLASVISMLLLAGCGDAKTTLIEKDPIVITDEHDHGDEENGRLAILSAESNVAAIYEIEDGEQLETFTLTHDSNTLSASPSYRFAIIASRSNDYVGFIDGGLWQEDHGAHLHDYQQAPAMSDLELSDSRPTHIIKHEDSLAVFFDGDASSNSVASVQVLTDTDISNNISEIPTLTFNTNMHGAAEPKGEHLLTTVRRDDVENTSTNKILPDQVGVYHLHDGEFEQEQILTTTCPDLHGAAQNHEHFAFGCSDGVLIAHQHDDDYESEKIDNITDLNGLRIGAIYGHEASELFIGTASNHGSNEATFVSIDPEAQTMALLEWQPTAGANPISYAFSYEGDHFLVLDSQGYLNILSMHEHDGEAHWELEKRLDITDEDVSTMPSDRSFSMTVAQNGHYVYVADPIAKHIVKVNLETLTTAGEIELGFAPDSITWLGIAEEAHEGEDDHEGHDH